MVNNVLNKSYKELAEKIDSKGMDIIKAIDKKPNGSFLSLTYTTYPTSKLSKDWKDHAIMKKTKVHSVRKGINYKHTKAYKNAVEEGLISSDPQKPAWQKHVREGDNSLVVNSQGTKYYIQVETSLAVSDSTWFLDGKEIDVKDLQDKGVMQPSYWNHTTPTLVRCITLDNIITVK